MYKILLSRSSAKFLDSIHISDRSLFNRFIKAFDLLSQDPYQAKALVGNLSGYYSYRIGDYRIIFEIERKKLLVYVEKIAHRSYIYK
jgi:mRNA interferase RelE/StbE